MSKKVRIELNSAGVRAMLKSPDIAAACMREASRIANACGDGYAAQSRNYPERSGAAVFPSTLDAARDNLKNNTLLRNL